MSVSSIIDPLTGKIYDELIGQGGGINLAKGQIITAIAGGTEVAFPVNPPADGTILSYDSNELTGLKYIVVPGAVAINYQELISADNTNLPTVVPAPLQNNYVLTSDNTLPAGTAGLAWKPATGGGGIIQTNLPLFTDNTTNPHTIGINFSNAVGEIPYGTATQVGALTNVPTAGQILGIAGNPAVPTWIPAGGSGTITATAPLTEYAIASASNIAIDFTAQGDLVVGNGPQVGGNPVAGVILPKGDEGQILSVASTGTGGLKWIDNTQHTGQEIIVRSNALTVAIPAPTDPKDTLVLVAEETQSAWDAIPQDITYPAPYNLEFQTLSVGGPGSQSSYTGLVNTVGGFRVIDLYEQNLAFPVKLGYFCYIAYQYGETQPTADSFIRVNQAFTNTGSNLDNYVIVGGTFNTFIYTISPAPNTVICYNIARLAIGGYGSTVSNLPTQSANNCGVSFDWNQRDAGGDFGVFTMSYQAAGAGANPRPTLWVMGNFTSVLLPDTQTSTDGYRGMLRYFPEANGTAEYQSVADTTGLGYGVNASATFGIINDCYFYGNYCAIVGSFTGVFNGTSLIIPIPLPAGMTGLAVMDLTQTPANRWGATPTGPVLVGTGNCIRLSQVFPGELLIGQSQIAGPVLYDTTSNQTSLITPSSPATFPAGMLYNSIASGTLVIVGGGPAVVLDALYMITAGNQPSYVYYLTAATGMVAQLLTPSPTGVIVSDTNGIMSAYGIQNYNTALVVSGSTSLYAYDPATPHATIDFTLALPNGFRQGNTITNTARFAQPAYQSQSYISSADKVYWIQTGGTTTGLTYF